MPMRGGRFWDYQGADDLGQATGEVNGLVNGSPCKCGNGVR